MSNPVTRHSRSLLPGALGFAGREMDDLFDRLFTSENGPYNRIAAPAAIWEEADQFHVEFELPGLTEDNVDVTYDKGKLTVVARRESPGSDERKYVVNERSFGEVTRIIAVPDEVDPETIEANFANGILGITLAKRPSELPKKIAVKSA